MPASLPPEELAGLPAVPDHWRWVRLDQLAEVVGGITKDSKRQADPDFIEVPYLRVANVQRGHLDLTDVARIRVPHSRARSLALQSGDVLFNEGGDRDKFGRGWMWEGQIPGCIHQNHVFRGRIRSSVLRPRLLSWWGNTGARAWFEARGKQTTNLASINLTTLKGLPVPVPPPAEQVAIEAEIDRRLSLMMAAAKEVDRCERVARALPGSILQRLLAASMPEPPRVSEDLP